jgi:hypothetical protein
MARERHLWIAAIGSGSCGVDVVGGEIVNAVTQHTGFMH